MALTPDQISENALNQAYGLMNTNAAKTYPYPGQPQTYQPSQLDYFSYTPNAPMSQVAAPDYSVGMMGGDYDRYEAALRQPGETAAGNAYNTGLRNLTNVMGGRGLYGSSIMGNQMNEGLNREYMNALAGNASTAAATRYQMQNQENQFRNTWNLQSMAQQEAQNFDLWKAGLANSEAMNQYNTGKLAFDKTQADQLTNYLNNASQQTYQYQLAKNAYDNQIQEALMNQALSVAGGGAPLSQAALNYNLAQQQLGQQQSQFQDSQMSNLFGGLLNLGGTYGILSALK